MSKVFSLTYSKIVKSISNVPPENKNTTNKQNRHLVAGWAAPSSSVSLREVHGRSPCAGSGILEEVAGVCRTGVLVAVGYMDPGNWATDLAGGARYGYTLLSVILISNLMAILLQALAVRLGIASGRDLAQACRDSYSRPVTIVLWMLCEIAIAACDLAEVIGAAIALNLLFGLPLIWGVCSPRSTCSSCLFCSTRLPLRRGAGRRPDRGDRRLLRGGAGARASAARDVLVGFHSARRDPDQSRHALHRARHPWRDGHAAQSLPALVDRADAEVSRHPGRQDRSDPVCLDRLSVALMSALFINAAILIMAAAAFTARATSR
jgi:hypothetical protein